MRGPAPLPKLRPQHIAKAQPRTASDNNSALRTQDSALPDPHSVLSPQSSSLPEPSSLPREARHSLAPESHARIDILLGASQSETISDILKLVRHAVRELPAGEHAFVVNSICSQAIMDEAARKISRRQAAKMLTYTASGQALREKLDFLETVIKEKHVRLLVISSFEFAATNARQRHALVHWLRQMRDEHALRIVVYSLAPEVPQQGAHSGPLALLAWLSDLVRHIRTIDEPRDFTEPANANETLKHLIEELDGETCFSLSRRSEAEESPTPLSPQSSVLITPPNPLKIQNSAFRIPGAWETHR
jgi:hypothetical protein